MAQVLPGNKRPSFSEGLLGGLAQSLPNAINSLVERRQMQEKQNAQRGLLDQENQALKERYGVDLTNFVDPTTRQAALKEGLRKSRYDKILGMGSTEPSNSQGGSPSQPFSPMQFSDQQLAELATVDPQLASLIQRQKEAEENNKLKNKKFDLDREKFEYQKLEPIREYEKSVLDKFRGFKETERLYNILEENADKRAPFTAVRKKIAEKFNLPESLFLNKPEEAMEKIAQQLLRSISKYYPGRILESEVQNFLKSNPSLLNSPEGQKTLAKLGKLFQSVDAREYEIFKTLKDQKGGLYEDIENDVIDALQSEYEDVEMQARDIMAGREPIPRAKPGEKGNRQLAEKLLMKFNNDKAKAFEEMKRLGYEP